MSEEIDNDRRRFFSAAAMTIAATRLGALGAAERRPAQGHAAGARPATTHEPAPHTSFGPLRQIDAGVLNVGYAETGPATGRPVILLHGWPYDILTYVD